jgi:signal transduction histidine kinase
MFALGALLLSATLATITYFTARQDMLSGQEAAVLRQTYANASAVRTELRSPGPQIPAFLDGLDTSLSNSHSVLESRGEWFSTSLTVDRSSLPVTLRSLVVSGTPASQLLTINNTPEMVVGIPIPAVNAAYFDVFSLAELARTLRVLTLALVGAAIITTLSGAVIGRWASGRALRPLGVVSEAAVAIASGSLETRLTTGDDADLAPLATSFNQMADALHRRIRREARFAADVSHELRSPLTTLSASLSVLETHREELAERPRSALDLLSAELRRFQQTVTDLLEIARLDAGSADLSLEEVDAVEFFRQAAAAHGASRLPLEIAPAAVGTRLTVDKRRMERVVANLVGNAEQHAGGVTRLAIEAAPGSSEIRLIVADQGPGIPLELRERIFQRFYRGQAAGRRGTGEGSGLGLSLVSEHLRLHGGRVQIEDGPGGEHRFVVELPGVER